MSVFPLRHYVLAGGESRRFGSDKARYRIDGQPMIQRVAEAWKPWCDSTTVVGQRPDQYADLGLTTIGDDLPHAGPLGGLRTALRHASAPDRSRGDSSWILLSACDLRWPKHELVSPLAEALQTDPLAAIWVVNERFEPFPGLFHTGLLDTEELANASSFQWLLQRLGSRIAAVHARTHQLPDSPWDLDRPPRTLR
ncbi:MAG: molybdenum cofactor guanylyltransferase [Planctomycetota bacterium]